MVSSFFSIVAVCLVRLSKTIKVTSVLKFLLSNDGTLIQDSASCKAVPCIPGQLENRHEHLF